MRAPRRPASATTAARKVMARRNDPGRSAARHARGLGRLRWARSNTPHSMPSGRERKGLHRGRHPKHVRQLLRDKQLLPMDIQETAAARAEAEPAPALPAARLVDARIWRC